MYIMSVTTPLWEEGIFLVHKHGYCHNNITHLNSVLHRAASHHQTLFFFNRGSGSLTNSAQMKHFLETTFLPTSERILKRPLIATTAKTQHYRRTVREVGHWDSALRTVFTLPYECFLSRHYISTNRWWNMLTAEKFFITIIICEESVWGLDLWKMPLPDPVLI